MSDGGGGAYLRVKGCTLIFMGFSYVLWFSLVHHLEDDFALPAAATTEISTMLIA